MSFTAPDPEPTTAEVTAPAPDVAQEPAPAAESPPSPEPEAQPTDPAAGTTPGPQSAAMIDHAVATEQVPLASDPPAGDQPANTNPDQFRAQPIDVDGRNRQHENAGLKGGFVRIVNGDKTGVIGVYLETLESGTDGYPTKILFRSRDAQAEYLAVAYGDVEAIPEYRGGR